MKKLFIVYSAFLWSFYSCYGYDKLLTVMPLAHGLQIAIHKEYTQEAARLFPKSVLTKLFSELIAIPKTVLNTMSDNTTPFINHSEVRLDYALFKSLTRIYPLCFLSECKARECLASRSNSSLREQLEEDVVKKVKERYLPNQELVYVSFGCGYLFTDCIILTKLVAAGYKNIKIHLIDKIWSEYIEVVKKQGNSIPADIEDTHKKRQTLLRAHTYRLVTFLSWLTHCLGKNVEICIYNSVKNYLSMLEHNSHYTADILTGVDYFESPNVEAIRDFNKLALIGTKEKGLIFYIVSGMSIVQSAGQAHLERIAAYGTLIKKVSLSCAQANKIWQDSHGALELKDYFEISIKEVKESDLVLSPKPLSEGLLQQSSKHFLTYKRVAIALALGGVCLGTYGLYKYFTQYYKKQKVM